MPRSKLLRQPEYRVWADMKNRCHNPHNKDFHHYGARGIEVCLDWHQFPDFFRDMGPRPSRLHTLDRINNNAGYCPGNCRWVTRYDQARNHRRNVLITRDGRTQCLTDWCRDIGINRQRVVNRMRKGWTFEEAIRPGLWIRRHRPRLLEKPDEPVS